MSLVPFLRQSVPLAALMLGGALVLMSTQSAEAQRRTNPEARQLNYDYVIPPRGVGGTSLRMRDVWGPAKMPPAPKDFGPHFDYPPASLNSVPTNSPYPN